MSHHFDTPTAKEDPRINICDLLLRFAGRPGHNGHGFDRESGNAGVGAPDTFRDEGLYAFLLRHGSRSSRRPSLLQGPVRRSPPTPTAASTGTFRPSRVRRATGADALKRCRGRTTSFPGIRDAS